MLTTSENWLGTGPAGFWMRIPDDEGLALGFEVTDSDSGNPDDPICAGEVWYGRDDLRETREGSTSLGFFLAFKSLPVIIFFSALMALLYHWRIMPLIIRGFAWLFTRLMRISGAESLCAASNIFVGIESATTVRPYLAEMTRSELCTILTAGMATIASSVLLLYASFLNETFPTIAGHLISASILSAPAAIVMSKILLPETGEPLTMGRQIRLAYERESGAMESIINGAMAGVKLVVGICALLIAFLGLIAVIDLLLGAAAVHWTRHTGHYVEWSLGRLLGYVFWPFAVVIGVPPADALESARLLGLRAVATEMPAYQQLASAVEAGRLGPRGGVVTAYGLCGFAHVASLAIFVGGIAALVPERRRDLASVGPRALLAATLACLMTGAVAGTFFHEGQKIIVAPPAKTTPVTPPATAPVSAPAASPAAPPPTPALAPVRTPMRADSPPLHLPPTGVFTV